MTTKEKISSTSQSHKVDLLVFGVKVSDLFGSYLHNEQSKKSDIDLLFNFDPEDEKIYPKTTSLTMKL